MHLRLRVVAITAIALSLLFSACVSAAAQDATPAPSGVPPTAAEVCGRTGDVDTTPPPPVTDQTVPSMTEFDLLFINLMASHHQRAVEMAMVAQARASHPEIQQMSGEIVITLKSEIAQMTAWKNEWYPDAPNMSDAQAMNAFDRMTNSMPGMGGMPGSSELLSRDLRDLARLCAATPDQFDLLFLDGMIALDQAAILLANSALNQATHNEIKTLAQAIITDLQKHTDAMLAWRVTWYPDATPVQMHE